MDVIFADLSSGVQPFNTDLIDFPIDTIDWCGTFANTHPEVYNSLTNNGAKPLTQEECVVLLGVYNGLDPDPIGPPLTDQGISSQSLALVIGAIAFFVLT